MKIVVKSQWTGDVRWTRNRPAVARDGRDTLIHMPEGEPRRFPARYALNQVDDTALHSALEFRTWALRQGRGNGKQQPPEDIVTPVLDLPYPDTAIWSEQTYTQSPEIRGAIVRRLIQGAEHAGMLSAGYLAIEAGGTMLTGTVGGDLYAPRTIAQCSMTVRDPNGLGSGWAGASSYDWARFDAQKLADVALDKCLRSRNPVRVEPGRYTLIMEPQAVFELFNRILWAPRTDIYVGFLMGRQDAEERERAPFHDVGSPTQTRLGQRILDERISVSFDPLDPDLGVLPFMESLPNTGEPVVPVTWFDRGVLTQLAYDRTYALQKLRQNLGVPMATAYRMSGGDTSIDEMVSTTRRGLIVTRFWGVRTVDAASALCTGLTRDGLWLIENGKISKPVKNMRFTESPFFAFNNVEQLGVPVPVFSPGAPAVVPPIKVREFSFTGLIDAV